MTITLKISDNTKQEMIEYFKDKKRIKTPPYAVFQADEADTVVTLYESGKVVFQGRSADIDANMWKQRERKLNPEKEITTTTAANLKEKKVTSKGNYFYSNCIGSDEVGVGDYFGPIVVTATYVKKEDIPFLKELGVTDSKKLTDDKILEIVPQFINKINYETILLSNEDYNKYHSQTCNLNKIKAILHNRVLLTITKKVTTYDYVIVDQFVEPINYYNYLKDSPFVFKKITFLTNAETVNLSVACASLISRYFFIKRMDELSAELQVILPYGANRQVDEVGLEIVKKHGFKKLKMCAKLNFKNTEKINSMLKS